jgi:hypothetical protein
MFEGFGHFGGEAPLLVGTHVRGLELRAGQHEAPTAVHLRGRVTSRSRLQPLHMPARPFAHVDRPGSNGPLAWGRLTVACSPSSVVHDEHVEGLAG